MKTPQKIVKDMISMSAYREHRMPEAGEDWCQTCLRYTKAYKGRCTTCGERV